MAIRRPVAKKKKTRSVSTSRITGGNGKLTKVSYYVRRDQVVAIESIQLDERRRTGQRPDKSELIQEALDLLTEKYKRGPKEPPPES